MLQLNLKNEDIGSLNQSQNKEKLIKWIDNINKDNYFESKEYKKKIK